MRVLFVYPNLARSVQEHIGLAYLSGTLRHEGIETHLWDNTFETVEDLDRKVAELRPSHVCFTALSADYLHAVSLARRIRSRTDAPIIVGGPHATFLPHVVIAESSFDVVVRGDGEQTLLHYLRTGDPKTKGAWVKDRKEAVIFTNPLGSLAEIDSLPWPDHGMFAGHFKKRVTWTDTKGSNYGCFITSRGCPYRCSYCSNPRRQELYRQSGLGSYLRLRSVDAVVAEVKHFAEIFNFGFIYFQDETLSADRERTVELCRRYKREIGLPWHAQTRPDTLTRDLLGEMAESGCELLMMGIESGSQRIREEIYNRRISRETLLDAFRWAREAGIRTSAFCMCGAPTETKEEVRETIALARASGADMGKMTIFTAFPGTALWDFCRENDFYIRERFPENYYVDSNVEHDVLTIEELRALRKEFVEAMGGYTGAVKAGEY
jgi:radical SAM superfamily enzyme YgiQ (UPF0313 family)